MLRLEIVDEEEWRVEVVLCCVEIGLHSCLSNDLDGCWVVNTRSIIH